MVAMTYINWDSNYLSCFGPKILFSAALARPGSAVITVLVLSNVPKNAWDVM